MIKLAPDARVGIIGIPPVDIIGALNAAGAHIFDLDEPLVKADMETTTPYLPRVYCAILRTALLNALHLRLDMIFIDTGPGKCDCALHVSTVLRDILAIPVIRCRNEDKKPFGHPICTARMGLLEKFQRITAGVQSVAAYRPEKFPPCVPEAGFWGVPPRDFSLLSLFPDTTHVFGWTRCMENKTPADCELEAGFNGEVPTVFFAQSFCAKTALAKFLATKHPRGLYLDADVTCGSSTRAKIQAFLELSGVTNAAG
ncbi:MAG: hypothetical protein HY885_13125 [Deltaproteobacteria bacterium]|nr:hypothetical protein [Deltaproteobacteria bacterium]